MIAERKHLGRSAVPKKWRWILRAIPNYDPLRYAGDCWFEPQAAEYYIEFIETCCTHIEGDLAGKPFIMQPWQRAIVANLFGWYMLDSLQRPCRRYNKCLLYVPRKNGKTPMVAAIHNALFFDRQCSPEAGQINNLAASSSDQAAKLYRHISGMITNEPEMEKRCQRYATHKSITRDDETVTKVIPADGKVAHGDNPYFQAIDELHAQPDDRLYEALTTAMASVNRVNQLLLMMTTADYDRESVCNDEYAYACQVRDGVIDDIRYLPVIYEAMHVNADGQLVEDEHWDREDTWAKANPNLGISVSVDYLRTACKRAKIDPSQINAFKRLHLNIRTGQLTQVINMNAWDACKVDVDWPAMAGRPMVGGLDIGATSDFTAYIQVFPHEDAHNVTIKLKPDDDDSDTVTITRSSFTLRAFFWLPEKPVRRNSRMDEVIERWVQQGYIRRTAGNVVDYEQVTSDIVQINEPYSLQALAVDTAFQGHRTAQELQKHYGDKVVTFRQGIVSMAAPFREFLEMILAGLQETGIEQIYHDGNPVLRWMASNTTAEERGGLIKPSKDKSFEKIDGITAATMAIGVAITLPPEAISVYEGQGIDFI